MPREGRIKDDFGIYHIIQKSPRDKQLFASNQDREQFLRIVNKSRQKNKFKIYAYCLTKPDEYHLILDAMGCDISKIMKEINIAYSIYKNCPGCLFNDRFKSELLPTLESIPEVTFRMDGPDQAGEFYSAACFALKDILRETHLSIDPVSVPDSGQTGEAGEIGRDCQSRIATVEEARAKLEDTASKAGLSLDEMIKQKDLRNQMIRELKACSKLSLKQLGQVFGELSESTVSKIVNS